MLRFLAICWRDLWRNRRRTILTGLVMAFSVAVMILFVGLGDGGHLQMIKSATDAYLGHAQIQHQAFQDEPDLRHVIEASDLGRLGPLLDGDPEVLGWAPRVNTGGLLSKKVPDPPEPDPDAPEDLDAWRDMASEGAFVVGVDPPREAGVSTLGGSVVADDPAARCLRGCRAARAEIYADGAPCPALCEPHARRFEGEACRQLSAPACAEACPADDELCDEEDCRERFVDYCEPARFLAAQDPRPEEPWRGEILLGAGLAQLLDVGVGDRVALMTGTARGRSFASLYRVVGVIKTGSLEINRTFAVTHYAKLASGLEIAGAATNVVLAVDDVEAAPELVASLDVRISGALPNLRALSWKELSPELDLFVKLDQGSLLVMLALLVMVVGVILANVVTMSVMERTREYGVRLALGESPGRITMGLIVETFLLALVACAVGAAIGEALNYHYMMAGIDFGMGEMETTGVVIQSVFYSQITLYGFVFSVGTVMGFSVIGAIYPAWRIRRLNPVDALRFV